MEIDSTYGLLRQYLYGHRAEPVISDLNEKKGSMIIDGILVTFLRSSRNPAKIGWRDCDVKLIVDRIAGTVPEGFVRLYRTNSIRGLKSGAFVVSGRFENWAFPLQN